MTIIDPFEFRDMFRNARSFAVVGNAPTVLDYEHGTLIDSHDVVVRFNRATVESVERSIGKRTDILVVNANNSCAKAPSPLNTLRPRCLVCMVTPLGIADFNIAPFLEWASGCKVLLSFAPEGLPVLSHVRRVTNGTCALYTFLRMFHVERLFVTGFTLYGAAPGGTARYYKEDAVPVPENWHDPDEEARIFAQILSQFKGELHLTPEVAALVKRNGGDRTGALNVHGKFTIKRSLQRRVAEALAWRVMKIGTSLRRMAESA